jgi:hypothetical protein
LEKSTTTTLPDGERPADQNVNAPEKTKKKSVTGYYITGLCDMGNFQWSWSHVPGMKQRKRAEAATCTKLVFGDKPIHL